MATHYIVLFQETSIPFPPMQKHYKNSFGYSGAVLWNSLPLAARQATSLTNFR